MRYRRNGDSFDLTCNSCGKCYAQVYPERVVILSFHYGHPHSTPIPAETFKEYVGYAANGEECDIACSTCDRSVIASIESECFVIKTKHRISVNGDTIGETHRNVWGIEEIYQISVWLGEFDGRMPSVEERAS